MQNRVSVVVLLIVESCRETKVEKLISFADLDRICVVHEVDEAVKVEAPCFVNDMVQDRNLGGSVKMNCCIWYNPLN